MEDGTIKLVKIVTNGDTGEIIGVKIQIVTLPFPLPLPTTSDPATKPKRRPVLTAEQIQAKEEERQRELKREENKKALKKRQKEARKHFQWNRMSNIILNNIYKESKKFRDISVKFLSKLV